MEREYIIKVNDDVRDATGGLPLLEKPRELVPCGNCQHYLEPVEGAMGDCRIKAGYFPVKPDWFCADGERKDGEQE